jgi:hypothetical protein
MSTRPVASPPNAARLGVADHLGWAVVVTVTGEATILDRRRIDLLGPDLPVAPVHHVGGPHEMHRTGDPLTDIELAELVASIRTAARSTIERELDLLATDLTMPIAVMSLRAWPPDFPTDVARQRCASYESQADPVMYRQELAEAATARGWLVVHHRTTSVETEAIRLLGDDDALQRPRSHLGPPWTKDHRQAFAAGVLAGR